MLGIINGRDYELNPAFITLLKYRAESGRSFLAEGFRADKLMRLMYLAITGPRPYYHRFEDDCRKDAYFIATAQKFFEEVTRNPEPERSGEPMADAKICEYELLALYTKNGLPPHLLDMLPVFSILAAINACCDLIQRANAPKEMPPDVRKQIHGITPARETQVMEYLRRRCESEVE